MSDAPKHREAYAGRAAAATDASRLAALQLVKTGNIVELGQVLNSRAPHYPAIQPPFVMNLWSTAHGVIRALRRKGVRNDPGINLEHACMTFHTGTHIDALGHFSAGQRMYGGRDVETVVGDLGLHDLGADMIPAIITRGVLLDVADMGRSGQLAAGEVVTRAALQKAEEEAGTRLREGDVALIRTGWARTYRENPAIYTKGEPGPDLDAARYLTDAGVIAIGADNMAIEVMPGHDPTVSMPVHQHALVDCGVYLIENMDLDALSASGHRQACFLLLTPRIRGATGSPSRPVAIL